MFQNIVQPLERISELEVLALKERYFFFFKSHVDDFHIMPSLMKHFKSIILGGEIEVRAMLYKCFSTDVS